MKSAGWFLAALFLVHALSSVAVAGDITLFGGTQNPGSVFGVRYGGKRVFTPEQTIAFAPNFLGSENRAFIINSNAILQVPTNAVRPYVTAGLGAVLTFGDGTVDIGTKFAINYGLGVKLMPRESIGVRVDYRRYAIPGVQSQTLRTNELSFGVVFWN